MGKKAFCKYDSNYRLLQSSDSENRLVKMTYEKGQVKPKTISDCMGNEKHYSYDQSGNIILIRYSLRTEQRFWYNQNHQLSAYLDGKGKQQVGSFYHQAFIHLLKKRIG